ncbi:hypothetical protein [Bacteroides sp. 224]|uniref:hypothetical protein n=1 Tax=Bacteroides sp. 224 TaxID=2302936 RepID=UPI0013D37B26|nr:hypothetical protein [Bacteroides sp. 224]NDV63999.1 hypothetical protein [Bacteroides sp. 224]
MKYTDFYAQIEEIKRKECNELYKAVEAHGGSYEWEDGEEDYPIIAIYSTIPEPIDVNVEKVYIENGALNIVGEDKERGDKIQFQPDEVFVGHLSYIIGYIPETEQIDDVSSEGFKTRVLFGDDAINAFLNNELEEFVNEDKGYGYSERTFSTQAEKDAYLLAIYDHSDWIGSHVLDDKDKLPDNV